MSGIAGLLVFDESLDAAALTRQITDRMPHRGPDGVAQWSSGRLALGHCLLRTTPEAATESQPLVDTERGLVLVWDGRLDNRDELFEALQPRFPRQGTPDAAYALEAYVRWGENCPARLLGDFAFALWDSKRHALFCARDVMGGAPFAYVANERFFAFASEGEALIGLPGVSAAPNEQLIAHLLLPQFRNRGDRRTWQHVVLALLAGESLVVEEGGNHRIGRYRTLDVPAERRYRSDAECQAHFLEVFGEAVRCRLRGAGAPAVMMSGGLDTAGVVAMMRRLRPAAQLTGIDSYSVIDDDPGASLESRAIQAMARLPGIAPHFAFVPSFRGIVSAGDLVEMAWTRAHPVDNWLLIQGLMCLAASRDGKRAMLHGASGDITLRSPHRYPAVYLRQGRFLQAWRECRAASQNHVYLRGISARRNFAANAYAAFLPAAAKMRANRLRRRWRQRADGTTLLSAEFTRRIQLEQRLVEQHRASESASITEVDAFHVETVQTMIMYAQSASGRVAARYAMELRDPWADRRVVEFFLGLPLEFKVRDGWTKYLVRTAFKEDLPAEVLWRTDKEHLGWRMTERLLAESRERVDSLITADIAVVQDYVDIDAARALYRRYLETSDASLRDAVFQLATLISWLKRVDSSGYQ